MISTNPRAVLAVTLAITLGALVFTAAPALAAIEAPETTAPVAGVTGVGSTTAVLSGVLNPHSKATAGWYFLYVKPKAGNTLPCAHTGGEEVFTTPVQPEVEAQALPVSLEVTGLIPNTQYTYCLIARNAAGEGAMGSEVSFTTAGVSNVGSSSAILRASLNPGGVPTSYFFEYGPTTAYGSTTASQSAGAGSEPVSVLANIEHLQSDTEYHFRVVVSNTHGTAQSEDIKFSTFPSVVSGLPDGRGYELVSPLNNGDATVVPRFPGGRAAARGDAVTYLSTTPPTGGNGNSDPPTPQESPEEFGGGSVGVFRTTYGDNQFLAERSAGGGWAAADIQPTGIKTAHYQSFSSDLSEAILESQEPLTENAPGNGYADLYSRPTASGVLSPLVTRTPSHMSFPGAFNVSYAGASADGSHQLFEANDALLEGVTPAAEELNMFAGEKPVNALYDRTGGKLLPVDVLPNGHIAPEAAYGSPRIPPGHPHGRKHRLDHVISGDGSRIFWTDTSTGNHISTGSLYVRENDSQPDASTKLIAEGAEYQTASSDGSKVFFTDGNRLTADSTAEPEVPEQAGAPAIPAKPDLYEYDFDKPQGERLTDLTVDATEPAHVMGVLGASEDGAYVYFAATGALAPGAKPQECLPPTEGRGATFCNVYALRVGESPSLVAAVTFVDGEGGLGSTVGDAVPLGDVGRLDSGDWVPSVGRRLAQVTPDGRHLVFESVVDLTGFDGEGSREIYLYDFGSGLSCVSCNPVGVPAHSFVEYTSPFELPQSLSPAYALRDLSTSGDRVFFNSGEALVPNDQNNRTDVYEWERDGSGSCVRVKGCLYLLSGGTSGQYSAFLDASESGEDVFVETRAQLVPRVHGEVYEVYDARVGAPREPAPPVCSGAGCQGVPGAPPVFATPSSVTFNGVGNFPPPLSASPKVATKTIGCRRGFVKRKGKCVRRPKQRFTVKRSAKGRK